MRWLRGGGQTDLPWRPTEPEKVRTFEALGHGMPRLPLLVYRGAADPPAATFRRSCRSRLMPTRKNSEGLPDKGCRNRNGGGGRDLHGAPSTPPRPF